MALKNIPLITETDSIDIERYRSLKREHANVEDNLEIYAKERLIKLTEMIINSNNFILVKFGDGEWRNTIYDDDKLHNCDNCNYFKGLGIDLIESYIHFLKCKNTYINKWCSHTYDIQNSIENDYSTEFDPVDKFLYYNLIVHKILISENGPTFKQEQVDFFTSIKKSTRTKIYVSNIDMIKALIGLLNITQGISIPPTNSYLVKHEILNLIRSVLINMPENNIILFSAGMFSKVMIAIISKEYPNNTYIDIGSTFDGLIRRSRDFNGTVEYQQLLLKYYG